MTHRSPRTLVPVALVGSIHGERHERFMPAFDALHRLYRVLDESGGAEG